MIDFGTALRDFGMAVAESRRRQAEDKWQNFQRQFQMALMPYGGRLDVMAQQNPQGARNLLSQAEEAARGMRGMEGFRFPRQPIPGPVTQPAQPAIPGTPEVPGISPAPQDITAPSGGLQPPTGYRPATPGRPAQPEVRGPSPGEEIALPSPHLPSQTFAQIYKDRPNAAQILGALRNAGYPTDQPINEVNEVYGSQWRAIVNYAGSGEAETTLVAPRTTPSGTGISTTTSATPRPGTFGSVAGWLLTANDSTLSAIGNAKVPPSLLNADGFPDATKVEAFLRADPRVANYLRARQAPTPYEIARLDQSAEAADRARAAAARTEYQDYLNGVQRNVGRVVTSVNEGLSKNYADPVQAGGAQQRAHILLQRARDYIAGEVQAGRMRKADGEALLATLPTSFTPPVRPPRAINVNVPQISPPEQIPGGTTQTRTVTNPRTHKSELQFLRPGGDPKKDSSWLSKADYDTLMGVATPGPEKQKRWDQKGYNNALSTLDKTLGTIIVLSDGSIPAFYQPKVDAAKQVFIDKVTALGMDPARAQLEADERVKGQLKAPKKKGATPPTRASQSAPPGGSAPPVLEGHPESAPSDRVGTIAQRYRAKPEPVPASYFNQLTPDEQRWLTQQGVAVDNSK